MVAIPMATAIHRFHPPILSDVLCIRLRRGEFVAGGTTCACGFVAACWDGVKLEVGEIDGGEVEIGKVKASGIVAEVGVKDWV
jgi:hypothetical protein